jgi:hypothetical protein
VGRLAGHVQHSKCHQRHMQTARQLRLPRHTWHWTAMQRKPFRASTVGPELALGSER